MRQGPWPCGIAAYSADCGMRTHTTLQWQNMTIKALAPLNEIIGHLQGSLRVTTTAVCPVTPLYGVLRDFLGLRPFVMLT